MIDHAKNLRAAVCYVADAMLEPDSLWTPEDAREHLRRAVARYDKKNTATPGTDQEAAAAFLEILLDPDWNRAYFAIASALCGLEEVEGFHVSGGSSARVEVEEKDGETHAGEHRDRFVALMQAIRVMAGVEDAKVQS